MSFVLRYYCEHCGHCIKARKEMLPTYCPNCGEC